MMAGFLPDAKKGRILLDFQGKNEVYPVQTGRLISPGTS
jgi:hypothetical protein